VEAAQRHLEHIAASRLTAPASPPGPPFSPPGVRLLVVRLPMSTPAGRLTRDKRTFNPI
jgi:hypothetical protein